MIKQHKVVAALPGTLEADSIYVVRAGAGFDLYVTNSSGTIIPYALNKVVDQKAFTPVALPVTQAGQVLFSVPGGYTAGALILLRGGVVLSPTEFVATNGTTVTLTTGAALGEILYALVFTAFQVANAQPLSPLLTAFAALNAAPNQHIVFNAQGVLALVPYVAFTDAEKTKLAAIAAGATANATDAQLRDRTTHTGTQPISATAGLQSALDAKQATEAGKGLSSNDFTSAEKTKLAGMESSHFRGSFVNEPALTAGATNPRAGDYADVDQGTGFDVMRYIYDVNDAKWTAQVSATSLTAAQIKSLYESNPDTNAFTGAYRTKLNGIETGATANESNANLRARSSHTGTQAISTVTDLQDTLDAKQGRATTLTAIAALTPVGDRLPYFTSGTVAELTALTSFGRNLIGAASYAAQRVLLDLHLVDNTADVSKPVSTLQAAALDGKQPLAAPLTAIAALAPAADRLPYFTSGTVAALATLTSFGRNLLAAASYAAQKVLLGLDLVDNTPDASKPVSTAQAVAIAASLQAYASRQAMAGATLTVPDTAGGTLYNVSSANPAITLGVAANMSLKVVEFRYVGSGTCTFTTQGADLIVLETAQVASFTLSRGQTVRMVASGNLWFAVSKGCLYDVAPLANPAFTGTVGIGTQTPATALNIQPPAGTLTTANQTGVRVRPTIDPALATIFIANQTDPVIEDKAGTISAARGFRGFAPGFLGTTATITLATGFDVPTSSSTQVVEFRAFESAVSLVSGVSRWQTYNGGTAPSYMNGDLRIGTLTQNGSDKLTVAGSASFLSGSVNVSDGNLVLTRSSGTQTMVMDAPAGSQRLISLRSGNSERWRVGCSATAEAGGNAGSDFFVSRYDDAGAGISTPISVSRSTAMVTLAQLTVNGPTLSVGPSRPGSYTLTTLPGASTYQNYLIIVSNAAGGAKLCYSNGTNWCLINTNTVVS